MKKLLRIFFLVQLIVLLGGYRQLHAHAHQQSWRHGHIAKTLEGSRDLFIRPSSSGTENQNSQLSLSIFENGEDDEAGSFKKFLANCNFPTTLFFTQSFGYLFNQNESTSPFYKRFSPLSSSWYLVLQVFRI